MKNKALAIVSMIILGGGYLAIQLYLYSAELEHEVRTLTLDASDISQLEVSVITGGLRIVGEHNRNQLELTADIYSSAASSIELSLERDGTQALLSAGFTKRLLPLLVTPYVDVLLKVPFDMPLLISNGGGAINIQSVGGSLMLKDGSGGITIEGAGSLNITDGSGDITLSRILGDVSITDGSGDIEVNHVEGNVVIKDGSGNILVTEIKGVVTLNDGSGDIVIQNAAGFKLLDDGSGNLTVSGVAGYAEQEAGTD